MDSELDGIIYLKTKPETCLERFLLIFLLFYLI